MPLALNFNTADWHQLNEEVFSTVFKGSAVKRTKYNGLKRNIEFIKPKL
jgi:epoxyqueuosine reductase